MADLVSPARWQGRRVLVTGHTGFKGSWLSLMLDGLGAEVHGLALDPAEGPGMFAAAGVAGVMASDMRADIRDAAAVRECLQRVAPEIVLHLAAQPLVKYSYAEPVETYAVNVLGTAHVLDAVRHCPAVRAVVVVTTDKCYENREWVHPYREADRLGGFDPYSNSKACAELVTQSFRDSFLTAADAPRVASARAGNVIGGGDWAADRLVPDCVRAWCAGGSVSLRYPQAVRPWQHVLEPLTGYLMLGEHLLSEAGARFAGAWNFGPDKGDDSPVGEVAGRVCSRLGVPLQMPDAAPVEHEAQLLRLDSTKAQTRLGWQPRWRLAQALDETVAWYQQWRQGSDMQGFSRAQIERYLVGEER